jgi:serine/threonine-protein kinase
MKPISRRRFIRGASTVALTAGIAGCSGNGGDNGDNGGDSGDSGDNGNGGSPEDRLDTFLNEEDAQLYDEIEDHTGEDSVTVMVGAGDQGTAFDPPAIRVSTGTTVTWEWTGAGGGHNVSPADDSDFSDFGESEIIDEEGHTVENTFDETGVALYVCDPHQSLGMVGGIIVE